MATLKLLAYISVTTITIQAEILRLNCKYHARLSQIFLDRKLPQDLVIEQFYGIPTWKCIEHCAYNVDCQSISVHNGTGNCEINKVRCNEGSDITSTSDGWRIMQSELSLDLLGENCLLYDPCKHEGTRSGKCIDICEPPGYKCNCSEGFTGTNCEKVVIRAPAPV